MPFSGSGVVPDVPGSAEKQKSQVIGRRHAFGCYGQIKLSVCHRCGPSHPSLPWRFVRLASRVCLWNGKTCDDRRVYSQIARWLSVRQTLDVWPLLLVVIQVNGADTWDNSNIIAVLKHNDRISELFIDQYQDSKPGKWSYQVVRLLRVHINLKPQRCSLSTTSFTPASALASSEDRFLTFSISFC